MYYSRGPGSYPAGLLMPTDMGRQEEYMAVMRHALASEKGTVLCVEGPPGQGKTTLLEGHVVPCLRHQLGSQNICMVRTQHELRRLAALQRDKACDRVEDACETTLTNRRRRNRRQRRQVKRARSASALVRSSPRAARQPRVESQHSNLRHFGASLVLRPWTLEDGELPVRSMLLDMLQQELQSWEHRSFTRGAVLLLAGQNGVGKTTTALYGAHHFAQLRRASWTVRVGRINCLEHKNTASMLRDLHAQMYPLPGFVQPPSEDVGAALNQRLASSKQAHIVLVDECDAMLRGGRHTDVFEMLNWPYIKANHVFVMLIGNTVNLRDLLPAAMQSRLCRTVHFEPYTAEDVMAILCAMFPNVLAWIQRPALQQICAAVSSGWRDIRHCERLLQLSVEHAIVRGAEQVDLADATNAGETMNGYHASPQNPHDRWPLLWKCVLRAVALQKTMKPNGHIMCGDVLGPVQHMWTERGQQRECPLRPCHVLTAMHAMQQHNLLDLVPIPGMHVFSQNGTVALGHAVSIPELLTLDLTPVH